MDNKLLFYGVTMDDREILIDLRPKHNESSIQSAETGEQIGMIKKTDKKQNTPSAYWHTGYMNPIMSVDTGEKIGMVKQIQITSVKKKNKKKN